MPYVTTALAGQPGPVVAVSDFMRAVPDLIARWVPGDYTSLGTDGFGLSDTRHALRRHFHVDAESIVVATLRQLARRGEVAANVPADAAQKYAIEDVNAAPVGETGGGLVRAGRRPAATPAPPALAPCHDVTCRTGWSSRARTRAR